MDALRSADVPSTQPPTTAPAPGDHGTIAIEEWFLHRGMPTVTRASSGRGRLLLRAAPAILSTGPVEE